MEKGITRARGELKQHTYEDALQAQRLGDLWVHDLVAAHDGEIAQC